MDLITFRQDIHRHPELSGEESETAKKITAFLKEHAKPDMLIEHVGGHGILAVYNGKEEGPAVLIRAELDGLPIEDRKQTNHQSEEKGKGHLCGHDGHMTMLTGVAEHLAHNRPSRGSVILAYQPAEETGEGAASMLADPKFDQYVQPDFVYALHNVPGYPMGSILLKEASFAAASVGLIIKAHGQTSHAAEPEKGLSPAIPISKLVLAMENIPKAFPDTFMLVTTIHVNIGSRAFGTTPGEAEAMFTIRAFTNESMGFLKEKATALCKQYLADIPHELEWVEEFPATENNQPLTDQIREICKTEGLEVIDIETPFRWSEDFGHFTGKFKGVLFGLGSGKDNPPLHDHKYDFPDEIAPSGINIFCKIIDHHLNV